MKLKTNTWHYKLWDISFDRWDQRPASTDLCRYCHRVFWAVMLRTLLALIIIGYISMIGYGVFYQGLYKHPVLTLEIIGVTLVAIAGFVCYLRWMDGKHIVPQTLAGKWLQARKQKVCPVVEFSDEDET